MVHLFAFLLALLLLSPNIRKNCSGLKMIPRKYCFLLVPSFLKQEISHKMFISTLLIFWEAGTRVALKITLLLGLLWDCTLMYPIFSYQIDLGFKN